MNPLFGSLRSRWPAIALAASLVLNAFLIGLAVESFRVHHGLHADRMIGFELRRLADRLPRDAAAQVAAELKPLGARLEPDFVRLRAMRDEVNRLAANPTPDRAAIDSQLAAIRAEASDLQAKVQQAIMDALLRLTPEQRSGLARSDRD